MPHFRLLLLSVLVSAFISADLLAQAPAGPAAEAAAAPAAEAASPRATFDQALADYKASFRQIEQLRAQYQLADEAERRQINARLGDLIEETKGKVDRMTAAALETYRAEPNADPQITDLLIAVARHLAIGERPIDPATGAPAKDGKANGGDYEGGDQPEQALEILRVLIDGGAEDPRLPAWGGVCAVYVNDFDLAEKYLTRAEESGQFDELPPPELNMPPEVEYRYRAREYAARLAELRARWEEEQNIRAAEAQADDLPRVKFTTSQGDIVLELFENQAPIATANMISLVKDGFYNDVVFHRVLPQFMAQGGDPTGKGTGGPGYTIECECYQPDARNHFRGSLSMAHAGRDTGGSQFFLTFVPTEGLDGRHTVFGRVIEGIEVLGELQRIDPQANPPFPQPDKILQAEVLRDRGHAYEFEKLPGR